ncbi:elongation factor 4 [Candidatus Peribacteria bacterium]|jgi:GTP-binding protein LepA|nr:elongation factor 4 [Candidatus Peribacteria bacterium]MBT4241240.1 elongation factor 4 [Candidatus Peribacteria bacterium]MBT4474265.1 elongation factor 4 [Candidatus Peribacteria bacterium]
MDIRNFCIIAHVDHGKSTLADRLLEVTGTVQKREMKEQLLDTMDIERERGITIKLQPARMTHKGVQLNLIDTPGHTDFRYEVSRSLAACEGAILLVDASQGIQAQTLATLYSALEHNLEIVPVLNKIDLPAADVDKVTQEVVKLIGCSEEEIFCISAKDGTGVGEVLDALVDKISAPKLDDSGGTRALIFDAISDPYRGVVAYVRVIGGELKRGVKSVFLGTGKEITVGEVGCFSPSYSATKTLSAGEIGYVVTGLKDVADARVGDTIASSPDLEPLPGYKVVEPMVFAGLYPNDADDFDLLREALEKLSLNDAALNIEPEQNAALGNGFRCGFLGLLHMDIIQERLEREYDCDVIITAPSVNYEVVLQAKNPSSVVRSSLLKEEDKNVAVISNPADFPDRTNIKEIREPWVKLEIVGSDSDVGGVMKLVQERRGVYLSHEYLDADRVVMHFEVPLQGIVLDFFDRLKSLTSGYGSMSYDLIGFRAGDLVKLDILLLGDPIDALSTIVHKAEANSAGCAVCKKLKEVIPRQQFQIPIQAAIGGKVVARETLSALRKDVTAKLYGGDRTRKDKLLKKQKKGKDRLKAMGKVLLPQEAFLSVLKR